ncbi:MAG: hypothetical protein H6Q67_1793 [Firmicutes bacterium]|nr:hypothetical protein [Bacillota bacterium]
MKNILCTLIFWAVITSAYAAPISNNQYIGQSTIGFTSHHNLFFETTTNDNTTNGLQYMSGKIYLYAQRPMNDTPFRSIIGVKVNDFHSENLSLNAKLYVGAAYIVSNYDVDEYTSIILGDGLYEFQIGANFPLSDINYFNINYRYSKDVGNKNYFGVGLITKM